MTMTPNTDTWTSRDLPVLAAAAALLDLDGQIYNESELESAVGLPRQEVIRALKVLNGPYLDVDLFGDMGRKVLRYNVRGITADGLRAVGQWPSPDIAADRMIQAIDSLIEGSAEGSPKSGKLKAARDALLGIGRDVFVDIAGAAITGRIPL